MKESIIERGRPQPALSADKGASATLTQTIREYDFTNGRIQDAQAIIDEAIRKEAPIIEGGFAYGTKEPVIKVEAPVTNPYTNGEIFNAADIARTPGGARPVINIPGTFADMMNA